MFSKVIQGKIIPDYQPACADGLQDCLTLPAEGNGNLSSGKSITAIQVTHVMEVRKKLLAIMLLSLQKKTREVSYQAD
jgi:hypothetical protein